MGKKSNNGFTVSNMDDYAPKGWGEDQAGDDQPYEYTMSSGSKVLLKRISMPEIFKLGFLDKLDFFSKALSETDEAAPSAAPDKNEFIKELLGNWGQMEETIDKILMAGVVAPVLLPNIPKPNRKRGAIYVDTVPFEDKVDLFGELLDTEGLSDFRDESEDSVGHVSDEQTLQDAPV